MFDGVPANDITPGQRRELRRVSRRIKAAMWLALSSVGWLMLLGGAAWCASCTPEARRGVATAVDGVCQVVVATHLNGVVETICAGVDEFARAVRAVLNRRATTVGAAVGGACEAVEVMPTTGATVRACLTPDELSDVIHLIEANRLPPIYDGGRE